ncbi:hypothetical protein EI613_09520 [Azospirillum sp. 412522]|nr:hypothetical protein [Azospirillum sp. 412522]MBY6262155.1 hypothetical protein [Azospirillum sp. 412522]
MPIDLASLRKLESPSARMMAEPLDDAQRIAVIVRLHADAQPPGCLAGGRAIAPGIVTGEIAAADLARLEADPAVRSMALSRPLQPS